MNSQHVNDLIDLYALDMLEPDEHAAVEAHLEACDQCRAQLSETTRVVELLAWAPDQHEPPPQLRTQVIEHVAQLQRSERAPLPTFWQRLQGGWQTPAARLSYGLSAALLVASLILGGRTWQLQQQLAQANAQLEQANVQLAQQQEVLAVIQSPGVQVASLTPPETTTPVQAQLIFNEEGKRAYLVTQNLPQLPPEQTYQFWLIADQPVSGGVFSVDQQGMGSLLIDAQQPLDAYNGVGISIEPEGGSPAPTPDAIVLLGEL